ncbi:hypothetical protein GCM10009558_011840 [Virgisporangium aurantiacum]
MPGVDALAYETGHRVENVYYWITVEAPVGPLATVFLPACRRGADGGDPGSVRSHVDRPDTPMVPGVDGLAKGAGRRIEDPHHRITFVPTKCAGGGQPGPVRGDADEGYAVVVACVNCVADGAAFGVENLDHRIAAHAAGAGGALGGQP